MDAGTYAVIMGDLVGSETASSRATLHRTFNAVVEAANAQHDAALVSPLTITLGDEFQGLAGDLSAAMRVARHVRLALMMQDVACRVLVGEVTIDTPLNRDRAWNMMGEGLARARTMLDRKRDTSLYLFSLDRRAGQERNLTAMGAGLTVIERRWTKQQRGDIVAAVGGENAEDTARRRGVSTHSVYKVRASGNLDAYLLLSDAISNTLSEIDADWRDRR